MHWSTWAWLAWVGKDIFASMSMFLDPPRKDDSTLYRLTYAASNAVALNFLKARNADSKEPAQ